jgi:hypothetical protein
MDVVQSNLEINIIDLRVFAHRQMTARVRIDMAIEIHQVWRRRKVYIEKCIKTDKKST